MKITQFVSVPPKYSRPQRAYGTEWLAQAHTHSALSANPSLDPASEVTRMKKLIERVSSGACIESRSFELDDFSHSNWDQMRIFNFKRSPFGASCNERMQVFAESAGRVFEEFYPANSGNPAPQGIIHVTCTGYLSPSAAQSLVARRGWNQSTQVTHAYHMGCAAAFPALRIALGFNPLTDIVHTELCTLHFNPASKDLEQLVVQTLFADGFIKYTTRPIADPTPGLEVLAVSEEIVPHSEDAMTWKMAEFGMQMSLSRKVPELIEGQLEGFLVRLFKKAGLAKYSSTARQEAVWAIHPGGPRIIDQIQNFLGLAGPQVKWSREVLSERGNMSSATLPHVWKKVVESPEVSHGRLIVSLAFAPGLTICGGIFRKA